MKRLIKKLLKEEEFKMESFFVAMYEGGGKEYAIKFGDNGPMYSENDDYYCYFLTTHNLDSLTNNPSKLTKISYSTESELKRYIKDYTNIFSDYNDNYGEYTQEELTSYDSKNFSEWVTYSDFNVDSNRFDMEIMDKIYIVEYHTSIVRSVDKDMMSKLTNL